MVGVTGFEPATPCTPCKCATGLRYVPRNRQDTPSAEPVQDAFQKPTERHQLFTPRDGDVLICDSHRGLLRMEVATGKVTTLVDEVAGIPMTFCSNAVAAADGTIYFSESTTRFGFEHLAQAR